MSTPTPVPKPALILSPILALMFVVFAVQKIPPDNLIFSIIAENSGIALFEPYIRVLTGLGEITAAGLLLFARTRMTGAVLGLAILLGAIGFHLSPWLGINVSGIGHGLFFVALLMLVLTLITTVMLRKAGGKILFLEK
jgi:hypothetical protein